MRLSILFCWLAGGYTQTGSIANEVCPDTGRTSFEGIAHAKDALHHRLPLFPGSDLFGHDNIVPLFSLWARHGARLLCAGLQGCRELFLTTARC